MPQVSVIIPTYNHRDHILATLGSVFAQTFTDYEVIVVNDGSPDDTAAVLRPLAKTGRIQYVEQPNQRQAAARNRGLSLAKGEFISFLDDDDLWPPDKLQWQVDILRQHPQAGTIVGTCDIFDESGGVRQHWPLNGQIITFESLFETLFDYCPICSPGQALIRADVIRKIGGFTLGMDGCDDWELWLSLAKAADLLTNDRLSLRYRLHSTNAHTNLKIMGSSIRRLYHRQVKEVPHALRLGLRRRADLYLYRYMGQKLALEFKRKAKARQLAASSRALMEAAFFTLHFYRSPQLVRFMIRSILPTSWDKAARRATQ